MNRRRQHLARQDRAHLHLALQLARRGYGTTSPNPMVGAVLVKGVRILGRGWHRLAGGPHAEIEALRDAVKRGRNPRGATLYVTLEPCSTHGRTPPCTNALIAAGIKRVIIGTADPNPKHAGKGFKILTRARIEVGSLPDRELTEEIVRLNEAFNHWIVHRTPFVTVKAALTLDGKIATAAGESKWITGPAARAYGMNLRRGADAILVGVNTILADDPALTRRKPKSSKENIQPSGLRRIVLDTMARTPLTAKVVNDNYAALTTIVVSSQAPHHRVKALSKRANVLVAPLTNPKSAIRNPPSGIDLRWLLKRLGRENITSLLVEGGGEVNASFLGGRFAHRIAFCYAPKIIGGRDSRKAVSGNGARGGREVLDLGDLEWRRLGPDLLLTARLK